MDRTGTVKIFALLALAAPAAGCGDESTRARALAETVGRDFRKECESAPAPDPALRGRFCACSEAKIVATAMRFGESDRSIGEKVRAATRACSAELRGAPGGRAPEH